MCVRVSVCVCVCVCQGIGLLIQRLWVRFPFVAIVGVSLSKKLYSHCSTPPSCNINGYLVITGEANVKLLSMSTNGCGPGGTTPRESSTPIPRESSAANGQGQSQQSRPTNNLNRNGRSQTNARGDKKMFSVQEIWALDV